MSLLLLQLANSTAHELNAVMQRGEVRSSAERRLQVATMRVKDQRLKVMAEVLNGIKVNSSKKTFLRAKAKVTHAV